MEWLVPVLFVVVTLAQWWLKHRKQLEEIPPSASPQESRPATETSADPMGEFGDLLEALGRRRHESAPPIPTSPLKPGIPTRRSSEVRPPVINRPEPLPLPSLPRIPETPILPRRMEPIPAPVFLAPTKTKSDFVPTLSPSSGVRRYPWRQKLHQTASVREALVLSEILAPPVALR